MTHGNRQDHLDDALAMVASRRLLSLPKYMQTRTKAVLGASGRNTSFIIAANVTVKIFPVLSFLYCQDIAAHTLPGHAAACKAKLAQLRDEAGKHGVADLDEALSKLESPSAVQAEDGTNDKHVSFIFEAASR